MGRAHRIIMVGFILSAASAAALGADIPSASRGPSPGVSASDPLETADSLLAASRFSAAESLALVLLKQADRKPRPDPARTVRILDLVTRARIQGGHFGGDDVIPQAQRAVALKRELHGSDHPDVAASLNNLGVLYRRRGDYPASRAALTEALAINEKALGPEDPKVAASLHGLASVLATTGENAEARRLLERAVAILEKAKGPDHPDIAKSLNSLGIVLEQTGDYAQARASYERALAIYVKAVGPDHPIVAQIMDNVANVLSQLGDYESARSMKERSLAILVKTYGPDHVFVGQGLGNFALLLQRSGDYTGARENYERAIAVQEAVIGRDNPELAVVYHAYGGLLWEMGDYVEARRNYEWSLSVHEKTMGPRHPQVARDLNDLGVVLMHTGDLAGARALYERALAIQDSAGAGDQDALSRTLANLGIVIGLSGDNAAARPYLERARALLEQAFGPEHREVASIDLDLAACSLALGDFDSASRHAARAQAIDEKSLGHDHPEFAAGLLMLGLSDLGLGDSRAALDHSLEAERITREHTRLTLRFLSERQGLSHAAIRRSGLEVALTLAAEGLPPADVHRVWDALVRSRALVLDEMASRSRALASGDAQTAALTDSVRSARRALAALIVNGPDDDSVGTFPVRVEEARARAERTEAALAQRSEAFRRRQGEDQIGLREVVNALPARSGLLAFARFVSPRNHGSLVVPGPRADISEVGQYVALVQRRGDPYPAVVPIGSASKVDSLVASWHRRAGQAPSTGAIAGVSGPTMEVGETVYRSAGDALRRVIWDPVAPRLRGVDRVFIVPDGSLHLVSFATLPVGDRDYLLEKAPTLHYLSAERDLLPLTGARTGTGLLALGGADFDAAPEAATAVFVAKSAAGSKRGQRSTCGHFESLKFERLPGTSSEVEGICTLWSGSGGKLGDRGGATRLTGPEATEAAFKRTAGGRRVLHLATHGFFLGDCPSSLSSGEPGSPASGATLRPAILGENPLLLSGLAMAGANRRSTTLADDEDNILTASEIAAMDLSGVQWAVLSACETGLGEIRSAEGVFGLRRAFQVAGARTVITSLWPVDDQVATAWMEQLYSARTIDGLETADAVRRADLRMLQSRRKRHLSTHPFYWGRFVAVGDWR